ncbi:hypothetical protein HCR02_08715 [Neisseria gonorrhoeae]|uniref:hypothetical protein n=1 Tax=Neisseria gonorrhoeae TaxID=485 RepID=UPI000CCFD676|nr:hypothetical protein [Neisseria gonorrhoeae]QNV03038.1 hypothetical protein HCR02_08715 [Neisseria gonorrhoeae]
MPSETRLAFRTAFSRSDRFRRTCSSRYKGNRLKQASAFPIPPAASRAFPWKYASNGKPPPETDTRHGRRTNLKTADYPSVLKALML